MRRPAVSSRRILIGSYDDVFYALDAATGDVRWRFRANGPVSGSATVLAGLVCFSTLAGRTYGLDAASGRLRWQFPDGKYSSVVADADRLYLVGEGRL
jgi:outer membrane protein assembly factor BamB